MNTCYPVPEAKKVMVLAPHADDETLGCGGTMYLYSLAGIEVHLVVVSDGGKIFSSVYDGKEVVSRRRQEALSASKILGVKQITFLDFPDGELAEHKDDIRKKLDDIACSLNPDLIFAPSPTDLHADHIAVSDLALQVLAALPGARVAFYEIYRSIRFNHIVDISEAVAVREKALMEYKCSLLNVPGLFCEAIKGLNRFLMFNTLEDAYYEAFWIIYGPLDARAIINWVTYGMQDRGEAELFFSEIKAVDHIFHEFKTCSNLIEVKETEINGLKSALHDRDNSVLDLQARMDLIENSYAWRTAAKFYRLRDRIVPEGSLRRKVYDNLSGKLKKR